MSYARFGWQGSDVYVYLDSSGYLCCCACSLDVQWAHYSTDDMIAHLKEHESHGHTVPASVYTELESDREENDKWIQDFRAGAAS